MGIDDPRVCERCGKVAFLNRSCGAVVCETCGYHNGLARCFCGWSASGGNGRAELEERGETIDPEDY